MSVNKVILVGNVGRDPEVRYLDNGIAVANFPLATSESYTSKSGERVTTTEWHNIVLWRGLAEVAEKYITKGKQLYIEGRIRTRQYDDKDGNKRYITEIYGDNLQMLGRKGDVSESNVDTQPNTQTTNQNQNQTQNQKVSEPQVENFASEDDDDLPF